MSAATISGIRVHPPAPPGIRVRMHNWLIVFVLLVVLTVNAVVAARGDHTESLPGAIAFVAILVMSLAVWATARIRSYRIADDQLIVDRLMAPVRFALPGLLSASHDREAMKLALRTFGNSGLGSICGRFRSTRLGKFRAYVSDTEKAVVLRWADRTVVVSPDRVQDFLDTLKPYLPKEEPGKAGRG